MTKGAAPGHVCVPPALPDTVTRTHAPRGAECLTQPAPDLSVELTRGTNAPCLERFSSSWVLLPHSQAQIVVSPRDPLETWAVSPPWGGGWGWFCL